MTYSLTWLPAVLEAAGLKVATEPGWKTRGRGDVGKIQGVICHHTATPNPKKLNMPTLKMLVNGVIQSNEKEIPGPLAQLGLGRDGTFYVIAAGRANHAGKGEWETVKSGNASFIGIEAENSGTSADFPWPEVQMDAYRRGVAAILKRIGKTSTSCCGHKEYRLPLGFKNDPSFDMNVFRAGVDAILNGSAPAPTLIPGVAPSGQPTLRRGMRGPLVIEIQQKLGVTPTSEEFGSKTEVAVREFQRKLDMVPDGIVGPKTWAELDKRPLPAPK